MGVLTDYFIADDKQLAITFAGWLTVANEPIVRETRNPFSGETQRMKEWPPGKSIIEGKPAHRPDLAHLSHIQLTNVEQVKIASLANILTDIPVKEALEEFLKPALIHPNDDEIGLHELPGPVTDSLRLLADDAVDSVATKWQESEEMKSDKFDLSDCKSVLQTLRRLAQSCKPSERIFLLWSL